MFFNKMNLFFFKISIFIIFICFVAVNAYAGREEELKQFREIYPFTAEGSAQFLSDYGTLDKEPKDEEASTRLKPAFEHISGVELVDECLARHDAGHADFSKTGNLAEDIKKYLIKQGRHYSWDYSGQYDVRKAAEFFHKAGRFGEIDKKSRYKDLFRWLKGEQRQKQLSHLEQAAEDLKDDDLFSVVADEYAESTSQLHELADYKKAFVFWLKAKLLRHIWADFKLLFVSDALQKKLNLGDQKGKGQFLEAAADSPEIKNDGEFLMVLAELCLYHFENSKTNDNEPPIDYFGSAARIYQRAVQLNHPGAREAYVGLVGKLRGFYDLSYGAGEVSCGRQARFLADAYGNLSIVEDIDALQTAAENIRSDRDLNRLTYPFCAKIYLRLDELGVEGSREKFYALGQNYNSTRTKIGEDLFAIYLQELANGDREIESQLSEMYKNKEFLKAVFAYHVNQGDPDSAMALYHQHEKNLDAPHLTPLTDYFARRADEGDLSACQHVVNLSLGISEKRRNYSQAAKYLLKAAELGDADAKPHLNLILRKATKIRLTDFKKLLPLCITEIDKGDKDLEATLVTLYNKGDFLKGALRYYTDLNTEEATLTAIDLVRAHRVGAGLTTGDLKFAREYYKPKADAGDPEACENVVDMCMGESCSIGGGSPKTDYPTAIEYYLKSIKFGKARNRENLFELLKKAAIDIDAFVRHLSEPCIQLIDEQNDPELYFLVGNVYMQVRFWVHIQSAAEFYLKAASRGHAAARETLSQPLAKLKDVRHRCGEEYITSFVEAIFPLLEREAGKPGQTCGVFAHILAQEYATGELVERNPSKAVRYFIKAGRSAGLSPRDLHASGPQTLANDEEFDVVRAAYEEEATRENADSLGFLLLLELWRVRDVQKANGYFEQAKEKDDLPYHLAAAQMFVNPPSDSERKVDLAKAREHYQRAEELGDPHFEEHLRALPAALSRIGDPEERLEQWNGIKVFYQCQVEEGLLTAAELVGYCETAGDIPLEIQYSLRVALEDPAMVQKAWNAFYKENYNIILDERLDGVKAEIKRQNPHAANFMGGYLVDDVIGQVVHYIQAARWGHPDALETAEKLYPSEKGRNKLTAQQLRGAFSPLLDYWIELANGGDETLYVRIAGMYAEEAFRDLEKSVDFYVKEFSRRLTLSENGDEKAYEQACALKSRISDNFRPDLRSRLHKPFFDYDLRRAEKGDPEAKHAVGQAYALGRGVERNLGTAASWFLRITNADGYEMYELARNDFYSLGKQKDVLGHEGVLPYYLEEARKGDPKAQYTAGRLLYESVDPSQEEEAKTWLENALENGQVQAAKCLGRLHFGRGSENAEDYVKAFEYFKRAKYGMNNFFLINEDYERHGRENSQKQLDDLVAAARVLKRYHEEYTLLIDDSNQATVVKESALGQMWKPILKLIESFSQLANQEIYLCDPEFMTNAVTIRKKVDGFIESFQGQGTSFVSIGKKNVELTRYIVDLYEGFKFQQPNLQVLLDSTQSALKGLFVQMVQMSAHIPADPNKEEEYTRISQAHSRLEGDAEILNLTHKAGDALKEFVKAAPKRRVGFFNDEHYGFMK